MSKKYTDKDLVDILAEVEVEFKKHLAPETEGEKISKSEPVQPENVESFDYDEEDMAEMEKMYKNMPKTEAEIHYKAVKKAMFGEESSDMNKSEISSVVVTEEAKMLKSENETLKAKNDELSKNLEQFAAIMKKAFTKENTAPKQKAITEMEVIKKSEEDTKQAEVKDLSKVSAEEISRTLVSKIRDGKLTKSEKEAVNKYYESKSIDLIKHLL